MKLLFTFCFGAVALFSQDTAPGWHRFGETNTGQSSSSAQNGNLQSGAPMAQPMEQQPMQAQAMPQGAIDLTIAPGTWITARINEPISTNRAQPGDAFMATLAEPIVVNGLVVARRGQIVQGRVAEVVRAGRVKGVSRLGIELTELSLVDGQQITLKTQLVERKGDTSIGRDATGIGVATGVGAAVGAGVAGGFGAGMGAIAGAVLGTTGVLTTRGRDTVLYPEQVLTFRLEVPVHVTSSATSAFQTNNLSTYSSGPRLNQGPRPAYAPYPAVVPYAAVAPYPVYSPYYYGGYGFGYPFFGFSGGYFGGYRYYGRGGYYRR